MRVCVVNQKGGTGKTTTSIHLAAALAKRGQKVLLLDNDPQGSIRTSFHTTSHGLADVLLRNENPVNHIQNIRPHLDLLGCDARLMEVEVLLNKEHLDKKTIFEERLGRLDYLTMILDMAPSRSILNEAALYFVDEVLIPVSCDYLALVGVRDILAFIDRVNEQRIRPLTIRGILPTLYDNRSKIAKETVELLQKHFPGKVFPPIHTSTRMKEAPSYGKTIFEYSPQTQAALDYEQLGNLF